MLAGGLAAALAVGAWFALQPARPVEPTSDLYTHLGVARHLLRGEGFQADIAYPLSFAWSFACRLPQPLVHRTPGFAMLVTLPVAAVSSDPVQAVAGVRVLQVVLLAAIAGLGAAAWLARGRSGAAIAFAVMLGLHPLLSYAADWGHDEVVTGLVLLAWWLRHREAPRLPGAADGALLGLLALLRPELLSVPLLAWVLRRPPRPALRGLVFAAAVFLAVAGPWAARNLRLTGQPFFSVQANAELLKDTRVFPGYDVYRQLEPQPFLRSLREHPGPVARKVWRGLRFFVEDAGALLPRGMAVGLTVVGLAWLAARLQSWRRRSPATALLGLGDGWTERLGPVGVVLAAAAVFYAAFDHSLRHFEPLLPLMLWELAGPADAAAAALAGSARAGAWRRGATAAAAALLLVLAGMHRPTGWDAAEAAAAQAGPLVDAETARLKDSPAGVVFVTTSAAPWLADRAAAWDPGDGAVRARITACVEGRP